MIRPYLTDLTNEHKPTAELNNTNNNTNSSNNEKMTDQNEKFS